MGLVLCAYSVLEQVTFLGIRSHINAVLGTVRLGQFQAGWTIAVQYLTFVVGPLASDYFPRLSEEFSDRVKTRTLINQQTAIGLQLGCPIIVAMIGFAPLIMKILYSAEFVDAVPMLRLLLLSDVVKLMNWPLGYAVLAAGDSKAFLRQGPAILAVLFVTIYLCVPVLGLKGVGAGLLVSQSVSLVWVAYYVYRKMGFRFDRRVLIIGMTYLGLAIGCLLISNYSAIAGMAVSSLIAAFGGAFAWKDIKAKVKRK
jgi:PST family polysaccharide transporter